MAITVNAEIFRSVQDAVNFVASGGGGIVYTDLAYTIFAKTHIKLPPNVKLEPRRPPDPPPAPEAGPS